MMGHSPEHIKVNDVVTGLCVWIYWGTNKENCASMPNCDTVKTQRTSTSGDTGTVWSSLVTVWMKESICRFLRSLRATSFSSSSICFGQQITDISDECVKAVCGLCLHEAMSATLRSHLHFEQAAVKQAFCLLQLVQLLCCWRSVQITAGQLHRVIDQLLPCSLFRFSPFDFNGSPILIPLMRGFRGNHL